MANGSILDAFLKGKQQKATLEQFKAEAAQQERLRSLLGQISTQPQQVSQQTTHYANLPKYQQNLGLQFCVAPLA